MVPLTLCAQDITGFWKTLDDQSGKAQCIVALYLYQGKYYGRMIATYDTDGGKIDETIDHPISHAPGVEGHPFYCGLDFIWGLQQEGPKYTGGKILDPEKGKLYDADFWVDEEGFLVVRAKLFVFFHTQRWPRAQDTDFPPDFKKPDAAAFVPLIPVPLQPET